MRAWAEVLCAFALVAWVVDSIDRAHSAKWVRCQLTIKQFASVHGASFEFD